MLPRASRYVIAIAVHLSLAAAMAQAHPNGGPDSPSLTMAPLDSFKTGGAEIAAHDPQSQRLFVTNAAASSVTILNARNPASLTLVGTIDTSPFGSPNSVAVRDGVVAIAIEAPVKTDLGRVGFYKADGELLTTVQVGALPDMLAFTPDGKFLLVANEGEPSGYGAGFADPEGSVSIIRVPPSLVQVRKLKDSDVRTVSFAGYNGQEAALRAAGIRIYGPGANAAMDFEPEYIGVTPDSRKAYVTLQENNAVAVIDIAGASVRELLPLGYKDQSIKPYTMATFEWDSSELPFIGKAGNEWLRLGGFSGLAFEGVTSDGKLKFITNTDRGPNGEPNAAAQRPFLIPQFSPRLVRFTLDPATGKFDLQQQIILRDTDGTPLSGLPNVLVTGGNPNSPYNDEVPIDLFGQTLPLDPRGGDFEGVVVDDDGSFWLCDEYRPAIYHFGPFGRLIERFIPIGTHAAAGLPVPAAGAAGPLGTEALPAALAQRRQNRGMEAIALRDGKIYAFVQSPARIPATLANGALNAMRNVRLVEFDPQTRAVRQFIYIMDNPVPLSAADTRADKIGDMTPAASGGFLVVERDDDSVTSGPIENITKKIYAFDIASATDISAVDTLYDVGGVQKSLDQMTAGELASVGVTAIGKKLHVDLAAAGFAGVQKIEGLALLDDGRLAVINDNDFTVAQIVIDNATGTFTRAATYVPEAETVGLISVPGLDASDRDSAINIRDWPVLGMYEPDAIAAFTDRGQTWFITANEGDARDWPGFSEEARISSLTLDPVAFPNGSTLKQNANLGRLNATRTLGDTDGDGDFDALFTLGGRSFSIWSANGSQAFDSEADLERIVAADDPAHFNASNDNNNFDDRSDNKGPEPEGLTLGNIHGRRYVFIGLERAGGIAAYDITTPNSPVFVDYVNNRDFTVTDLTLPEAGDLGPEGVLFISEHDSPTRQPLLVVANEISGTVTTYGIEFCARPHHGKPRLDPASGSVQGGRIAASAETRGPDLRPRCRGGAGGPDAPRGSRRAVGAREILLALHLREPARGALEFELQFLALVELGGGRGGRDDHVDAPVVELVDHGDEATRGVVGIHAEHRHVGDDDALVFAGDGDVVGGAARALAKSREFEPDDVLALTHHLDLAVVDADIVAALDVLVGQIVEQHLEPLQGCGVAARQVDGRRGELAQPIVDTALDRDDDAVFLEQADRGQEAIALQAVLVKIPGFHVGREYQGDAALDERAKQPREDHGIGDVGDEQLVETDRRAPSWRSCRQLHRAGTACL